MGHFEHFLIFSTLLCCCRSLELANFTNPITTTNSPHPSILKLGASYYLTFDSVNCTEIIIYRSDFLTDFSEAENKTVYKAPSSYSHLTNTNIQKADGQLVIYFSMQNGIYSAPKLFVITANDPNNPMGKWSLPAKMLENIWDGPAYHGSVMVHNKSNYFVFTSNHVNNRGGNYRSIYIAPMKSVSDVIQPVTLLKAPSSEWECVGICSNDAPAFIQNRGVTYLFFSGGADSSPNSSLSYLSIHGTRDPLSTSNWALAAGPIFTGNISKNIYGVRHATFTTSPDATETWMLYQASDSQPHFDNNILSRAESLHSQQFQYHWSEPRKTNRTGQITIRTEKITWDKLHGTPIFPKPHGFHSSQKRPSGEPEMFTNPVADFTATYTSVIYHGGFYYLLKHEANGPAVSMIKSRRLTNFMSGYWKIVVWPPKGYNEMFDSNIQLVNGELYIYTTLSNGNETRLVAFQAKNSSDPMGEWSDPVDVLGSISSHQPTYGRAMKHNGQLYFVWSDGTNSANIYISRMATATRAIEPAVILRKPREPWECPRYSSCNAEAPYLVYRNNVTLMFYSAGGVSKSSYDVSYMSIESGMDPLDVINWVSPPGPVFPGPYDGSEDGVYGVGRASFTVSPDESETWMMYHASDRIFCGKDKTIRIEKIGWSESDNTPIFPKVHGPRRPQPVPSSKLVSLTNFTTDEITASLVNFESWETNVNHVVI